MADDKKEMVDKLKKELQQLEWEEKLLRKRDDRLKWEEEMLEMEEGLKDKRENMGGEIIEKPSELDMGVTYLVKEDTPVKANKYYLTQYGKTGRGLYITRQNPQHVKKTLDLGDSEVCWLTGVKATDGTKSIFGLQELSILISNFVDKNQQGVVLLDGIEYLISNNDFQKVLRLIQQIRDKVSKSDFIMLIPLNPDALDTKQVTLLERECIPLK